MRLCAHLRGLAMGFGLPRFGFSAGSLTNTTTTLIKKLEVKQGQSRGGDGRFGGERYRESSGVRTTLGQLLQSNVLLDPSFGLS